MDAVMKEILSNSEKIWNSVEIHEVYLAYGGQQHLSSNKNRLMDRVSEILKEKIYLFKSPGVATILMHKQKATSLFQLVSYVEEENDVQVDKVAKQIIKEIKVLPKLKDSYPPLDKNSIWQSCSETLLLLLANISPSLSKSLPSALLANIVTTAVTTHPSMIQIALGLLAREKKTIQQLYAFGVSASYDEIRRYKISAAATSTFSDLSLDAEKGLIQGVCDNYDTNISSQNGLKSTHSLATIITQPVFNDSEVAKASVPRLKKVDLKSVKLNTIEMQMYKGEKKPLMPLNYPLICVLPLKVLCRQVLLVHEGSTTCITIFTPNRSCTGAKHKNSTLSIRFMAFLFRRKNA